jgi:predicted dehydrogenase
MSAGDGGAERRQVGIGLIGSGFMGKGHAVAYRLVPSLFDDLAATPRLRLLADVDGDTARRAARELGFEASTGDWRELVAHPEIDVVDITAPNHLHAEMALAALAAGKHVYCEKPLALDAASARAMADAAQAAGVVTLVGFNYLKSPAALAARRLIEEGVLGEIWHFRGTFHQDVLADPGQPFGWRFERERAGAGALGDLGAHVLALARFLVGDVARVCALASTVIAERPQAMGAGGYGAAARANAPLRRVENEDAVHALLAFAGGASGVLETSRVATGRKVHLELEIIGSRGSLLFDHERMNELRLYLADDPADRRGFRTIIMGPEHPYYARFWPVAGCGLGFGDMKVIEVYELLQAVARGDRVRPDFADGAAVQRLIDAILTSAGEGRWVETAEFGGG